MKGVGVSGLIGPQIFKIKAIKGVEKRGNIVLAERTPHRPSNMAYRSDSVHRIMVASSSNSVRAWRAWAIYSVPARVTRAYQNGAQARLRSGPNCRTKVRPGD